MTGRRGRAAVLLPLGVLILGVLVASAEVGRTLYQQAQDIEASASSQAALAGTNLRVLSTVERELLRVDGSLRAGDPALDIRLLRDLAGQRIRESTLDLQRTALPDPALMVQVRRLADDWTGQVRPIVDRAAGTAPGSPEREAAHQAVSGLERKYFLLIAEAEDARKVRADREHQRSQQLQQGTSDSALALAGLLAGLLLLLGIGAWAYRWFQHQRVRQALRLVELNRDVQTLSQVATHTANPVLITDRSGRLEWFNTAVEQLTGWTLGEAAGHTPGALFQGAATDPEAVDRMRAAVQSGEGFREEVLNYHRSGRPFWIALDAHPVQDESGAVRKYVAVGTDMTSRRETEEQLRQATRAAEEASAEKSRFLANLSHEMVTPLNSILGLSQLVTDTGLDPEQDQHVRLIRSSGEHLLSHVHNVLTHSALESGNWPGRLDPASPVELVRHQVEAYLEIAAISEPRIRLDLDPALDRAFLIDSLQLRHLVRNLVDNAVRHNPACQVTVSLRRDPSGVGDPAAPDGGIPVLLEVRDTGRGIPLGWQHSLLRPYSQLDLSVLKQFHGPGLGLATCGLIARQLGGTIELSSGTGQGTTVSFRTVLAEAGTPAAPTGPDVPGGQPGPSLAEPADRAGLSVLVVDDNAINRHVACRMLARRGITADVAEDGIDALDRLADRDYDLILLDVNMPRLDGLQTASTIHASGHQPLPYIVAVTANTLPGDVERCLAAGMDGFLPKPLDAAALDRVLQDAGRRAPVRPASSGPVTTTAAAEEPLGLAPLDVQALAEVVGDELVGELVTLFVTDARERLAELAVQLAAADLTAAGRTAHTLAGAAANVRAGRVEQLARAIERDPGGQGSAEDVTSRLETEIGSVEQWWSRRAAPQPAEPQADLGDLPRQQRADRGALDVES